MSEIEAVAALAREAGAIQRARLGTVRRIERKVQPTNLVTEVDHEIDALLVRELGKRFGARVVVSEEGAHDADADEVWHVDPLDGTTNYAHAFPHWCVSIAFEKDGAVRAGVVFDPLRDEMFAAAEGEGATLNGRPIRVSRVATLDEAIVATGFPYDRRERAKYYMAFYEAAVVSTQGVRRAGAAALDMAWVANGRLDAYFEQGIRTWDVSAGELLVREAGGTVTAFDGGAHVRTAQRTLASNGLVHAETVALLADVLRRAS